MARRLEGKVAIVTGGAGGIGAATAQAVLRGGGENRARRPRFRRNGSRPARKFALRCPKAEILEFTADVAEEAAAAAIVAATRRAFGRIDVVVNNAGIRAYEPLAEARRETWETILAVNLLSYAYLAREALPDLRSERGSIVNVSSTHAFNPRAGMGQYDVTKAGIVSLTRTLAFEEAAHGVRVNAVCPGATFTPFHKKRAEALGRTQGDVDREAETTCLMRRWATPREIAFPILWLASDEASYITGAALMVDGGRLVI